MDDSLRSTTYLERPPSLHGLQDEHWKLIRRSLGGNVQWKLYDRHSDPREDFDLAGDPTLQAELRALGYVE